ncbi:HD domain-containing protein [candidate division KSB3 bacterium]|uniref:HD domain-containing protein n=1 Tax=candidate division KSB3 bacterium TaxID=2044937 RepID=A0A9D5JRS5_9BACT|nr:HD domain-containing protein [candidate division KSB3 bacterium]MBD3322973.1 HD domain-containing protein [candidate division KSB3 bacterium]
MTDNQGKFQQIIDVSMEFAQAKDLDLLLGKILHTAQKMANADKGSIYLMEDDILKFHHTQQKTAAEASSENAQGIYKSRLTPVDPQSVAAYVAETGDIVNIPDTAQPPSPMPYSLEALSGEDVRSLLVFPLKNNNGQVTAVLQLINPKDETGNITGLSEDDTPLLLLFANNAANAIERSLATRSRVLGIIQILTALRDTEETIAHVNRVGAYASEIYETWAREQGIDSATIDIQRDVLRMAAMLHDLGKLAIPNIIRRKPGRLDPEEYETMKQHTIKGAQLLLKYAHSEIEEAAAQIALTHHERWDGTGYPGYVDIQTGKVLPGYEDEQGNPLGKKGEEIPVFGRIVAIADVYDALSHHRVFREAWKEEAVLKKLQAGAGKHFDPAMLKAFFASLDTIHAIAGRFQD